MCKNTAKYFSPKLTTNDISSCSKATRDTIKCVINSVKYSSILHFNLSLFSIDIFQESPCIRTYWPRQICKLKTTKDSARFEEGLMKYHLIKYKCSI